MTQLDSRDPAVTDPSSAHSSALAWRRWAFVLSPVLGGALIAVASGVDPAVGADGRELYEKYAAETDLQQLHTVLLHWGFGFFGVSALFVTGLVRGRGAWLANVAAALGFTGIITLPGLVAVDFMTAAFTQAHGVEATLAAEERFDAMWGLGVFALPGMIGLIAGPVLGAVALARAGLVRWWAPAAVVLSFLAVNLLGFTWWGGAIMTVFLGAYSVALFRATDGG
jgi:hypothetical protein